MAAFEQENHIPALVNELCGMLRRWSDDPGSLPIGDIDKAASTLKKLQDILAAEQDRAENGGQGRIIVTHHIPRTAESEERDAL